MDAPWPTKPTRPWCFQTFNHRTPAITPLPLARVIPGPDLRRSVRMLQLWFRLEDFFGAGTIDAYCYLGFQQVCACFAGALGCLAWLDSCTFTKITSLVTVAGL